MYRTIMVGVDGSKPSEKAFEIAADMAKRYEAKLMIVTVYSPPAIGILGAVPPYPPVVPKEVTETLQALHDKLVAKAKEMGVKTVQSKIVPAWNVPGAGFVTEAEKQGCALTVIGSRGMTGITRAVMGSTAEYVAKNAHCSVHIVR